jgi:hypothetical protein
MRQKSPCYAKQITLLCAKNRPVHSALNASAALASDVGEAALSAIPSGRTAIEL